MKKKFLAYAAIALSMFVFPHFNALAQENPDNPEIEITEEQNIDSIIVRCETQNKFEEVEKKYKIINQKKTPKKLLKFKTAGNAAFEKAQKLLEEAKEKTRIKMVSEIISDKDLLQKYKENAKAILEKGVMEATREFYSKNNDEHLFTQEVIEDLKENEQYYKEMAEVMLKNPKAYVELAVKQMTTIYLIFSCDDDTIINSILESLLEAEENFNKII